jgi:hypothetical protein
MDAPEREWAEAQLRAERKKNARLGIVERLDVTMARVRVGGSRAVALILHFYLSLPCFADPPPAAARGAPPALPFGS